MEIFLEGRIWIQADFFFNADLFFYTEDNSLGTRNLYK